MKVEITVDPKPRPTLQRLLAQALAECSEESSNKKGAAPDQENQRPSSPTLIKDEEQDEL